MGKKFKCSRSLGISVELDSFNRFRCTSPVMHSFYLSFVFPNIPFFPYFHIPYSLMLHAPDCGTRCHSRKCFHQKCYDLKGSRNSVFVPLPILEATVSFPPISPDRFLIFRSPLPLFCVRRSNPFPLSSTTI